MGENPSQVKGLDRNRMVRDILFDNVVVNGKKMEHLEDIDSNEFVENVRFK